MPAPSSYISEEGEKERTMKTCGGDWRSVEREKKQAKRSDFAIMIMIHDMKGGCDVGCGFGQA